MTDDPDDRDDDGEWSEEDIANTRLYMGDVDITNSFIQTVNDVVEEREADEEDEEEEE